LGAREIFADYDFFEGVVEGEGGAGMGLGRAHA
jgi:hypothetical protein